MQMQISSIQIREKLQTQIIAIQNVYYKDKEETKRIIFDGYLRCLTYKDIKEELAKELNVDFTEQRISQIINDDLNFKKFFKILVEDPEYSNNWKTFKLDEEQLKREETNSEKVTPTI